MRNGDEINVEWPDIEARALRDFDDLHLRAVDMLLELSTQEPRRERRRINRHPKARPCLGNGADVIFMCVGDKDAGEALPLLLYEAQVGKNDVDPWLGVVRERNAKVDHQPLAILGGTEPIKIDVEANFSDTAQRRVWQAFLSLAFLL